MRFESVERDDVREAEFADPILELTSELPVADEVERQPGSVSRAATSAPSR